MSSINPNSLPSAQPLPEAPPCPPRNSADVAMKHSHYYKSVSHLDYVDVYRVLNLFEISDPCLQHAIKKLLVAGRRGAKDFERDIKEAQDSLTRCLEMRNEDSRP